jgi:condensin complex subunit 1
MAEQAINTVYALGDRPDLLCASLIKTLSSRAFSRTSDSFADATAAAPSFAEDETMRDAASVPSASSSSSGPVADSFELSQLLFVVGHVAIKHLVFLELVEREMKRQKDHQGKGNKSCGLPNQSLIFRAEKSTNKKATNAAAKDKDGEELDQVAGNAEDEIGERIAAVRENEMLSVQSLLGTFGSSVVQIAGSPHKFKVCAFTVRQRHELIGTESHS